MMTGKAGHMLTGIFQRRFQMLLVFILLTMLVSPLLENYIGMRLLLNICFTAILLSAAFATSDRRSNPYIASFLALPMLFSYWAGNLLPGPMLKILGLGSGVLFFLYIISAILTCVLRAERITQEVISGALVVYLLLGLLWTFIYSLTEHLSPGSFFSTTSLGEENRFAFLYYSYVTLTTLGYGDVTPLTPMATSLAVLEAIIGQIYLTVLIARLVGMHIAHSGHGRE